MKLEVIEDDSGTAAMKISPELQNLRGTCDRMDIKWHWRHKASSLIKMIKEVERTANSRMTAEKTIALGSNGEPDSTSLKPVTEIPADVRAALDYMYAYKRANAKLVEAFIESLL